LVIIEVAFEWHLKINSNFLNTELVRDLRFRVKQWNSRHILTREWDVSNICSDGSFV